MSAQPKILVYLLRRDLRVADNPILHHISDLWNRSRVPFTSLLPVYVFPAEQVEVSGFLSSQSEQSPYPEARSAVGNFWRCGHHRAKFLAESVWDVKKELEAAGSGLLIRAGMFEDVVKSIMDELKDAEVTGLWMTSEEGVEEKRQERAVRKEVQSRGAEFKLWKDEKYFIDDDDLPFTDPRELPDIFTSFRKQVEPLRDAPRSVLPKPATLPPLPTSIPPQASPFKIPENLNQIISALHKPLSASLDLENPPTQPASPSASSSIPFAGGATAGHARLHHLLRSGAMTSYKDTRNGLLGTDYSSKLSAWLALGCLTARQVHAAMVAFEDGTPETNSPSSANDDGDAVVRASSDPAASTADGAGFGQGENKGTAALRFELLWRDYMRLCTRKFGPRLFRASGFRGDTSQGWKYDTATLQRWLEGTTGMGLVDAAQRELFLTGYTSNRTRQNVASFLAKRLGLDWRLGAEWYECCLVDYDVSSNWGNWQYNAGVGNDPREGGVGRVFNPVKQAHDYDRNAEYVRAWVAEVAGAAAPTDAFQYTPAAGAPLVTIQFERRGGGGGGGRGGRGRGGRRGR